MAKFLVSIGDSDKYVVNFDGDKKQLENCECIVELKNKVSDYLKKTFPTGGYEAVVPLEITEDDGARNYQALDETTLPELLKSASMQVEVLRRTNEQNLNAPFDKD